MGGDEKGDGAERGPSIAVEARKRHNRGDKKGDRAEGGPSIALEGSKSHDRGENELSAK